MAGKATQTRAAGRNLNLDFVLAQNERLDPLYVCTEAPLKEWAQAVWDWEANNKGSDKRIGTKKQRKYGSAYEASI